MRKKTALYLDQEKVSAARAVLGAATVTATIDAALDAVIATAAVDDYIDLLASDAVDADLIEDAWGGRS